MRVLSGSSVRVAVRVVVMVTVIEKARVIAVVRAVRVMSRRCPAAGAAGRGGALL
jgi:hypothetical protein